MELSDSHCGLEAGRPILFARLVHNSTQLQLQTSKELQKELPNVIIDICISLYLLLVQNKGMLYIMRNIQKYSMIFTLDQDATNA